MGRRLIRGRLRRGLSAVAFTLLFITAVFGLDRLFLGARPVEGWIEVLSTDDVPAHAGTVMIPAYLPDRLVWPASRVLYRAGDDPGWWMGVRDESGTEEVLWIGTGTAPLPESLGNTAACLDVAGRDDCPEGWFALSTNVQGQVLYLLSRLDPSTAREILMGLRLASEG